MSMDSLLNINGCVRGSGAWAVARAGCQVLSTQNREGQNSQIAKSKIPLARCRWQGERHGATEHDCTKQSCGTRAVVSRARPAVVYPGIPEVAPRGSHHAGVRPLATGLTRHTQSPLLPPPPQPLRDHSGTPPQEAARSKKMPEPGTRARRVTRRPRQFGDFIDPTMMSSLSTYANIAASPKKRGPAEPAGKPPPARRRRRAAAATGLAAPGAGDGGLTDLYRVRLSLWISFNSKW